MLSYQSSLVSGKLVVNSMYKIVTNTNISSVLAVISNYLLNFHEIKTVCNTYATSMQQYSLLIVLIYATYNKKMTQCESFHSFIFSSNKE